MEEPLASPQGLITTAHMSTHQGLPNEAWPVHGAPSCKLEKGAPSGGNLSVPHSQWYTQLAYLLDQHWFPGTVFWTLKPACLPHLFLTLTGVLPGKPEFSCLNSLLVDYLLWLIQTNFDRIKEICSEKR